MIDKGKIIEKEWDENNLISQINDCINIENSIQEINKINDNIKKSKSNKYSKIEYNIEENHINNLMDTIKNFGKIITVDNERIKKDKKGKKKLVDKYYVTIEVKGWEKDQDLGALAKKIISTIKKDGLKWNTGYKLEEVAFGIKKLVITFFYEEDKISVEQLIDELESWEDEIQSVDIVSVHKS